LNSDVVGSPHKTTARNLVLGTVHAGALQPYLVNGTEVAAYLVARLHREIAARPGDDELTRLLARVLAQPSVPSEWRVPAPGRLAAPFVTVHLRSPSLEVRLFTMLTSIGTPLDVTAEEIHIETYFPAARPPRPCSRRTSAGSNRIDTGSCGSRRTSCPCSTSWSRS